MTKVARRTEFEVQEKSEGQVLEGAELVKSFCFTEKS